MGRIVKSILAIFAVAALLGSGAPASADPPPVKAADSMTVSPGGVDLRTGRFTADISDLSIGEGGAGAIELKRQTGGEHGPGAHNQDRFGQYSANWDFVLKQYRACSTCTTVSDISISVEGASYNFYDQTGGVLKLVSNTGFSKLVRTMVGTTVMKMAGMKMQSKGLVSVLLRTRVSARSGSPTCRTRAASS